MNTKRESIEANLAMALFNLATAERVINDPHRSDEDRSRARAEAEEHRRDVEKYQRAKREIEQINM